MITMEPQRVKPKINAAPLRVKNTSRLKPFIIPPADYQEPTTKQMQPQRSTRVQIRTPAYVTKAALQQLTERQFD